MPYVCRPTVLSPEHEITLERTLELVDELHAQHPDRELVRRMITNTEVRTRQLIRPIEETLEHPGFEVRNDLFVEHAHRMLPEAVAGALRDAGKEVGDIGQIVFVTCTGFTMPSMTAWMINELGFEQDTVQLPLAQVGCAGGGAGLARAVEFCTVHPGSASLVVCCEFCSLLYQPDDVAVGNLLSNGLFGDAVGAVVVTGEAPSVPAVDVVHTVSALVPGTEDWISYDVKETGFHFRLDRRVPGTMEQLAPVLDGAAGEVEWDVHDLAFHAIHAGGPRILDDLALHVGVRTDTFAASRTTLHEHGNVASVVVLDVLRRLFDAGDLKDGDRGIIAGFGPGITAEVLLGTWAVPPAVPSPDLTALAAAAAGNEIGETAR